MIEIQGVSKSFEEIKALQDIHANIKEGAIFGLIGSNGAGKSTLLRIVSGILKQDRGTVLVDGEQVYENVKAKENLCFIPDTAYFLPNATGKVMAGQYEMFYPKFDREQFVKLAETFKLDLDRKIGTFSKGMKKQMSMLLGICANTKYLLCDETFDGLDPVMRQAMKSLLAMEIMKRDFTPVIASHNLRELEDICDHVGLLHKGGILFTKDLEDMKFNSHKVQCVFQNEVDEENVLARLEVMQHHHRGKVVTIVARGTRLEILDTVEAVKPIFAEVLPLTLEEIFISETEVAGYDIKKLIF